MPHFLARKTETYHYLIEADSKDKALEDAEDLSDYDWEQSDGPLIEIEADTEGPTHDEEAG